MEKNEQLKKRNHCLEQCDGVLKDSRVYLSGPMDFVASRAEEKKFGWRNRITDFLTKYDVTIFDPWNKPDVLGLPHYGKEDEFSTDKRQDWHYRGEEGDKIRAILGDEFWSTLHIDLRMVDTSDFIIAFVPTNVYSVGTVHEIVMAKQQNKPILFVSPYVEFNAVNELEAHLKSNNDQTGKELLEKVKQEVPIRDNLSASPSMWYMALVDGHYFFDGFGFAEYADEFGWELGPLDEHERDHPPERPLLPYLASLNTKIPMKYDVDKDAYIENADWLLFDGK